MRLLDKLETTVFYRLPMCFWSGGDSTAQNTETSAANFTNTLQNSFNQQFAAQSGALSFLNGKLTGMINNPTGYSAPALAAMRTSATDQVASQFQAAKMANQNTEFSRGGENLPSGVNAQINAGLTTQAAQAQSAAQNNITQQNAQLQNQNYWNATNALMGVSSQYNPNAYAGDASQSAGEVAGLSSAVTAANGPTIGAVLGGIGTGVASSLVSGGMSNLGKGKGFFG